MTERIVQVQAELAAIAADARESFGTLTGDQINWKPSTESWSVGQCLDHLIKSSEQFYPEFDKLATGARRNSFWQNYSPFTGLGGRFLVNAVMNDSKKVKAPSKNIVPPSDVAPDVVDHFVRHIEEVSGRIGACAAADLKRTVVTSPFLAVFTYTLDDAYTVLVEHSKRHIRQAKRIMEMPGFPEQSTAT